MGPIIQFSIIENDKERSINVELSRVIIAGWTGRNKDAMEAHIAELEEIGVARPKRMPMFYRVSKDRITTASIIEAIGTASSGEVEFFLIKIDGEIYVGAGSDHTDREAETQGVTLSKQMCDKPISATLWPLAELKDHWTQLLLRSTIVDESGGRIIYQDGSVEAMLAPDDLLTRFAHEDARGGLCDGDLMMCGTLPAIGGIRRAARFEFELIDPVRKQKITHGYDIVELPIVG